MDGPDVGKSYRDHRLDAQTDNITVGYRLVNRNQKIHYGMWSKGGYSYRQYREIPVVGLD